MALENDGEDLMPTKLTDEQLELLERERELHLSWQTKSYTRQEAIQIIKGQRDF